MIALIDADMLVYRSAFAAETSCYKMIFTDGDIVDLGPTSRKDAIQQADNKKIPKEDYTLEMYKKYEPSSHVVQICKKQLENILEQCCTSEMKLILTSSDKSNYRFAVAKIPGPYGIGYKEGRASRPKHYETARNYMISLGAEIVSGIEADDALGIMSQMNDNYVMVHQDKDINMIPGKHYDPVSDMFYISYDPGVLKLKTTSGKKPKKTIYGTGLKWFYAQMLLGDRCDNIPGIYRIGAVKAYKLLKDTTTEQEMIDTVWKEYYNKYSDSAKDRFLEVADLLWIQRKEGERKSEYLKDRII